MRLFQVILDVRDMDAQARFYRDVLGCTVLHPADAADFHDAPFVRLDAGGALLALHAGRTEHHHGQEPRLSFLVDDLEQARERLRSHDVPAGEPRSPAPGIRIVDARDPEGNAFHFELHEHDPAAGQ